MLCSESITLVSLSVLSESKSNQANPDRPTLCRNCGAIVGAGGSQCAVCGASTTPQVTTSQKPGAPDGETIRFARAVLNRPYKFTIILLVANLFVFLLMWESSGLSGKILLEAFPEPVLEAYGAKLNSLINAPNYQWWRFVTPMFVHVNLPHLLINMYSLWIVGPYVEKLYGSAKFVVFWVLTGVAGVIASYLTVRPGLTAGSVLGRFLFKSQDMPSAGASGALFGLVGVLFVFGIKFRRELPEGFKRAFGTGMLPIIMINLFIGYLGRGLIDNAAHLGGLLSGAALALVVQYRRPGESPAIAATWRLLQLAALGLVGLGFFKVAQNFNPPVLPPPQNLNAVNSQATLFLNYVRTMTQAQETVAAITSDRDISNADTVANNLTAVTAPDAKALELKTQLLEILAKMATVVAVSSSSEAAPKRPPKLDQKLLDEYAKWQVEYEAWVKTAAQTYTAPAR
jgi:membrane associated rhomboid family serine protease